MIKLWCYIEGHRDVLSVSISPSHDIYDLKKQIYDQEVKFIIKCGSSRLTLTKVDVIYQGEVREKIRAGEYRPTSNDQVLDEMQIVSAVWPEPHPEHLHVSIRLPGHKPRRHKPVESVFVREYKDVFIKVEDWGAFEESDIERNMIYMCSEDGTPVPDFVAELERELDGKPGLAADAYDTLELISDVQFVNEYFGPLKKRPVEDGSRSPEEFIVESESDRCAGKIEVTHLAYIASGGWELCWGESILKEPFMNALFFQYFAFHAGSTISARTSDQSWPFNLITKCETAPVQDQVELRKFLPRSDFLVSKSNLPRLLVQVSSKPIWFDDRPPDLVRMLLTGASVVRFANRFLNKYMEARNFVLFAIYIWDHGKVSRYSMFQEPNSPRVHCNDTTSWLKTSVGRAKFVRRLYNLRDMLERDKEAGNTEAKIKELENRINQHNKEYPMKSFNAKGPDSDVDDQTNCAELGAHGYEVEPRNIVDESGHIIMEPLFYTPSHILTVYKQSDPSKLFIAKKVYEDSNELEIFKLLNTFQPKSEHIISLHESFKTQSASWLILPQMSSVAHYVSFDPENQCDGKIAQVCWGLIKSVAYLHKFCIAHRDIKPENLLVDWDFCLKIIDFDIAMRVKDEDEVVDGQCGTEGWLAPEIEEKWMYSPIKADRWSSGQVIHFLLDRFRENDSVLRTTAKKLTTHNPDQRSSMLQVAASLSDVANVAIEKKAKRSLQDTEEVDGENTNPPPAKKQKLSVLADSR